MTSLSFLSWNLALMTRSAEAPIGWGVDQTEAVFRDVALAEAPDLILLQELPRMVPFVETHGMVRANPETHSGNLATLVRQDLMLAEPSVGVVTGCAVLTTIDEQLTVANVHLAPGPGKHSEGRRLEQLADIVEASPTEKLVIIGDTNTRLDEVPALEAADLVGEQPPKPTWDGIRNRFNRSETSAFRAYFTRWFASPGVTVSDVRVLDEPVTHDGHSFHLSDHFPIAGTITW